MFAERANESIHQLKYALEERHFTENKDKVGFDQSSVDKGSDDVDRCSDNSGDPPWEELQHSHAGKITLKANSLKMLKTILNLFICTTNIFAYNQCVFFVFFFNLFLVNQLKILLQHQEKMESEASPSRRKMQFRVCFFLFLRVI